MITETNAIVTPPGDLEPMAVGPQEVTVLTGAERGAPVGVIDYRIAPGFSPPPYLHRHTREDAGWVVLEGALEFHLGDGSVVTADAGSSFVHPRGCWFRWRNPDPERPARALCWFSPSGFERFFVQAAGLAAEHLRGGGALETFGPKLADLRGEYGLEPHPDAEVPAPPPS